MKKVLAINDKEILIPALNALQTVTFKFSNTIEKVLSLAKKLFFYLESNDILIAMPALKTVGNIICGTDLECQSLINLGVIDRLISCLDHKNNEFKKEAALSIGNIIAGTNDQMIAMISNPRLSIGKILKSDYARLRQEGLHCIQSVIAKKYKPMIMALIEQNILKDMFLLFTDEDVRIVLHTLYLLDVLVRYLKQTFNKEEWNALIKKVEQFDGLNALIELENNCSSKIYTKVKEIYDLFNLGNTEEISTQRPVFFHFS